MKWLAICITLLMTSLSSAVFAQIGNVLVIDQQTVFDESAFFQELLGSLNEDRLKLRAENQRIFQELRDEELAIAEQRHDYTPEEFEKIARAFDEKVQATRRARSAIEAQADKELTAIRDVFRERIGPVIAQIMMEQNASIIIDRSMALWWADSLDVTQLAIDRIDQTFVQK